MIIRSVIVDDSSRFLEAARRLLERDGIVVVGEATTIAEALEQVDQLRPDVVLADIDLAGESGFELVRRLHDEPREARPRMILISTYHPDDFADLIEASPAEGFLSKSALSASAIRDLLQRKGSDVMNDLRSMLSSADRDYPPGPLAGVKRGATSDPGYPQPQAAEVESAHLLANDSRQRLRAEGFSDEDTDRLADDFIAEDRGEETAAFMDWAHRVRRAAARPQPSTFPTCSKSSRTASSTATTRPTWPTGAHPALPAGRLPSGDDPDRRPALRGGGRLPALPAPAGAT